MIEKGVSFMKKFLSFLILSIFFICICPAQENKPIEGYDGFSWGTTIRKVTKKYPYGKDSGAANLREYYVSDKTSSYPIAYSKTFRFYEKKLYFGRTDYEYYYGEGGEEQLTKLYDNILADLKRDYNLGSPQTNSKKLSNEYMGLSYEYILYGSLWRESQAFYIELVKVENPLGVYHITVMFYDPLVRAKAENWNPK